MKVSVIIPFHKGLSFLEDCFQSLIEQSYQDMEIILVCDRVEEDVDSFVKPYKEQLNLRVFFLEDKSGVAAARNYGFQVSSGEYIYFLDSDDYIGGNTLTLLVSGAEQNNADIVYGKKIWTWFKRSIFLESINNGDNESDGTTDGEDEEQAKDFFDAEDSQSDKAEDRGNSSYRRQRSEREDSVEDEEAYKKDTVLKEDFGKNRIQSQEKRLELEQKRIEVKRKTAYVNLVSRKKGVRNISVLNILMKRSLIEEHRLKFNEEIHFLTDYPFVLQALSIARTFENQPEAIYIKRNHNDSVNLPSLGQMKGSKSFKEYTMTYLYAIGLLQPESDLRKRLDKKIIYYCVRYFAPKLIKMKKQAVRKQQYKVMHEIISNMDKELIKKQKRYKRKLLHSFYTGDMERTLQIVNRHFKWKKLIKIIKNRRTFIRFLYKRFFLRYPVKENWVFCESFFGKSYSGSPKYIYEYIEKNHPGQFRFIWVINRRSAKVSYPHTKVKRFSIRYVYYLARCKYYIFNGRQPEWVKKRKGNVFLQTWHGTPLKRLVFDMEDVSSATPRYKEQVYNQSRAWDYLIAPNQYSSEIFRRCFMFEKIILETGYPRNDILHSDDRDQIACKIREKLEIPVDKKTILYAPTWRDDEYYTKGKYKFTLKLNLELLKKEISSQYVVLLRTHYFIADALDLSAFGGFAYNVSNYDDISELYLISDVLITDYSSVFFDYANLRRPMLFFTYDLEKYRDVLRGFYIDIEEELPGPLLFTTEEIVRAIRSIDSLQLEYREKYAVFYDKYCSWEDGQASRRVVNAVFHID
jgi:CDP-glycerol glycerophosphotransferase